MNGTVLLPSFNRANEMKEFFKAYLETESTVPGLVIVDRNDPQKEEYTKLDYPEGWHLVITEARKMGDKFREVWDQYKDLDFVIIMNDDHRPKTKGWDQTVISQLNGSNVVSTNDGATPDKPWNAPNRICGAIAFSGKIYRTLGWLFPPGLNHLYSDDVWGYLFGRTGNCQVLMDICVFHDHAYLDEKKKDDTYYAINGKGDFSIQNPSGGMWDDDRKAFERWIKEDAENDLKKIIQLQPKQGLMIATPTHDGTCAYEYALGLADLAGFLAVNGIYFEIARVMGSSLIPHARNSLVDMFMKSKCQKLLFIDADQGFNKDVVLRLFQSSRRIVAGVTPHKRFPMNLNFDPKEDDQAFFKDLNNKSQEEFNAFVKAKSDLVGEIEVSRSGTGFMMIDRSVFEILEPHVAKYFPFDNNDSVTHGEYFAMGSDPASGRYKGEDWKFIEMAKEHSIPIFINHQAIASHRGGFLFEMQPGGQ